jgi:hypothetical protein
MKVKYSQDFKRLYLQQDQAIKDRFFVVDAFVVNGDLRGLRQQGWMYFEIRGPLNAHGIERGFNVDRFAPLDEIEEDTVAVQEHPVSAV